MTTEQPEALRLAAMQNKAMTAKFGKEGFDFHVEADTVIAMLDRIAELDAIQSGYAAARLEISSLQARTAELEAARFAYANEFEPTCDGDPDVSSIHANIRALKAQLEAIGAGGVSALIGASQAQPVGAASAATVRVHNKGGSGEFRTLEGIDALEDGAQLYATPQPAAQALDALKKAGAIAVSAAKTNSRDIADWRDDMHRIAAIAAKQGGTA